MKKVVLFVALLGMVSLQSCKTYKATLSNTQLRTTETEQLMADLEVGKEHITGTFTIQNSHVLRHRLVDEGNMVLNAVYDALQKVDADALVGLQYKMETEYDRKLRIQTRTVTITGYPVWYRNFRPVQKTTTEFEVQELKSDTPYVIIEKDSKGDAKGYRVVKSTQVNNKPIIPLEKLALDKVVLGADDKK